MNIRYPIYEGVYRILTLQASGHHPLYGKYDSSGNPLIGKIQWHNPY